MDVAEMRVMGRATQGVRLINLKAKDEIAAVTKIALEHIENENNMSLDEPSEEGDAGAEKTEDSEGDEENGKSFDTDEENEN